MLKNLFLLSLLCCTSSALAADNNGDWPTYGGDAGGMRYSALKQITPDNVKQLQVAWIYHSGDISTGANNRGKSTFEVTPILFGRNLYLCTPFNRVIALDAATGQQIWHYDPQVNLTKKPGASSYDGNLRCRGVTAWIDKQKPANRFCQQRIFEGVIDGRIIALDAKTGQVCKDFGSNGQINLNDFNNFGAKEIKIGISSPPVVYQNLLIVGSAIGDNNRINEPHGIVRAFDTHTGALQWSWDPIPLALKDKTGAANVWAPISVDTQHGIVYLPTTSPSPDYYGGKRSTPIPFADAVVALHAKTGMPLWHFQTVHHNLWDYDVPAQPVLFDMIRNGQQIPALAQTTKTGFVFLFNRLTGQPLFPIIEKPVPQSDVPGEHTAPTQPEPALPAALARQTMTAGDAWGMFYFDRVWCRNQMAKLQNNGLFTPPSLQGSLELPLFGGGSNWGGAAYDPNTGLLIVNTMNLAGMNKLIPRSAFAAEKAAHPEYEMGQQLGTPYGMERKILFSPLGVPCTPPPWGMLSAIDVSHGTIRWQVPFGSVKKGPFLTPEKWGSPNIGGSLVTASGLIFIGAAMDSRLHAYDIQTGNKIWHANLPNNGMASPMSYSIDGKQYVIIAAGGHGALNSYGDALVAFALPN